MQTINTSSIAEGLALIAEGLDRVELATGEGERKLLMASIRSVLNSLVKITGEPEALTWPHDSRWISPFNV